MPGGLIEDALASGQGTAVFLAELDRVRRAVAERGDQRLALLLAGVELYAVLGREFELLEIMRTFAHEMHEAVEGTPSIKELEDLFNRDPPA